MVSFLHQGIWLPDGEKHFPEWMDKNGEIVDGRGTYQIKKWRACLPWIKDFRVSVDVGAHIGFWSIEMAKKFETVHAFEPVEAFRECFNKNVVQNGHVLLYANALGSGPGMASMRYDQKDSGGTHIVEGDSVTVRALDEFVLGNVDFVKIDCEGYEHKVVEGARETLMRCRPCVIVEQKAHKLGPNFGITGQPAVALLLGMGATLRQEVGGDYILSW